MAITSFNFSVKLWYISGDENSGYKICNMKYRNHCLTKWGSGDVQLGTHYNAKDTWNIVLLFKRGEIRWNKIMSIDNTIVVIVLTPLNVIVSIRFDNLQTIVMLETLVRFSLASQ